MNSAPKKVLIQILATFGAENKNLLTYKRLTTKILKKKTASISCLKKYTLA